MYVMRITEQLKKSEQKIKELKHQLEIETTVYERLQQLTPTRKKRQRKKSLPPRKNSLAAHLQKILKESNEPLTVSELVEKLNQNGFESTAQVSLNTLVPSALSRRPDVFIRVKRGLYGLKGRDEQEN